MGFLPGFSAPRWKRTTTCCLACGSMLAMLPLYMNVGDCHLMVSPVRRSLMKICRSCAMSSASECFEPANQRSTVASVIFWENREGTLGVARESSRQSRLPSRCRSNRRRSYLNQKSTFQGTTFDRPASISRTGAGAHSHPTWGSLDSRVPSITPRQSAAPHRPLGRKSLVNSEQIGPGPESQ